MENNIEQSGSDETLGLDSRSDQQKIEERALEYVKKFIEIINSEFHINHPTTSYEDNLERSAIFGSVSYLALSVVMSSPYASAIKKSVLTDIIGNLSRARDSITEEAKTIETPEVKDS